MWLFGTIKVRLTFIAFILSALVSTGSIYSNYDSNVQLLTEAKHRELSIVGNLIQKDFLDQFNNSAARASLIASFPPVIKALREKNREELTRLVLPSMENQKKLFKIWDAEFDVVPSTAFLRPFNLSKYGDDVSSHSEMVLKTTTQGEPQEGVEIVSTGIGMRGTAVVKDSQGLIGSFVMAKDINSILNTIKSETGFDIAILINNHLWKKTVVNKDAVDPEAKVIGGLLEILISGSVRNQKRDFSPVEPVLSSDLFVQLINITEKVVNKKGVSYGYIAIPLLDFKGEEIGAIVAVKDFKYYTDLLWSVTKASIIASSAQTILLSLFVYFFLTFYLTIRVNRVSRRLTELNAENSDLTTKKDEIVSLAMTIRNLLSGLTITIVVICTVIFVATTTGLLRHYYSEIIIQNAEQKELRTISSVIDYYLKDQANEAAARASLIINLPPVQQAFKEQNRQKLLDLLKAPFEIQALKFGIRGATFYNPPASVFLQIYQPDRFGEDVSSYNKMVLKVNTDHQSQEGIEILEKGVSIQAVEVVSAESQPVGSFEILTDFSRLLSYIKNLSNFDTGVFIDKDLLAASAKEYGQIEADRMVGNYINTDSSDWRHIRSFIKPDLLTKCTSNEYKIVDVNDSVYGVIRMPLVDFNNKNIGFILSVANFKSFQNQLRYSLVVSLANIAIQIVFISGIILILLGILYTRPFVSLSDSLLDIVSGKQDVEIPYLKKQDILGCYARNIEEIKKKFSDKKKGPE